MSSIPVPSIAGDIPPFTASSVLPPFTGGNPALAGSISPYRTSLVKLVDRFATSQPRKDILQGYLSHRAALLSLGISGLQWLDGSFLEDIESSEGRAPGDIDVVTFVWRPAHLVSDAAGWTSLLTANLPIFQALEAKKRFNTDAYFVDVSIGPQVLLSQATYWFGLFSHRRVTSLWKGILEVPLAPTSDDSAALALLSTK